MSVQVQSKRPPINVSQKVGAQKIFCTTGLISENIENLLFGFPETEKLLICPDLFAPQNIFNPGL